MQRDNPQNLYADIARAYLKSKRVYKYLLKKIEDISDDDIIQRCHWWYEENGLRDEYMVFKEKMMTGQ
ncbi:MAG TPA: hypothetical protein DC001_04175 [Clostridiales bacterium]|jgi:hypothetical protein|nr:hypothetical protein [Clostridiales bacterium]HBR07572.1 hypothetical protein [Clostridiales bacterium]